MAHNKIKNPKLIDQSLYDNYPEHGLSMSAYVKHRADAGLVGIAYQTVKRAFLNGRISKNRFGKFDPRQADLDWFNFTDQSRYPIEENEELVRPVQGNQNPEFDEPISLPVSKARKEHAQARLAELKVEEAEGRLINKTEAYAELFNLYRVIRDRLLGIPVRMAPIIVGIDDQTDVEHKIEDEIVDVLNELAQEGRRLNGVRE